MSNDIFIDIARFNPSYKSKLTEFNDKAFTRASH